MLKPYGFTLRNFQFYLRKYVIFFQEEYSEKFSNTSVRVYSYSK